MLKKIFITTITLTLCFYLFSCNSEPDKLPETEQEITFDGIPYKYNFSWEFNDDGKFPSDIIHQYRKDDKPGDGMFDWLSKTENVVGETNLPENLYVKDGSIHMIEQHYQDKNGLYHQNWTELWGINLWFWPESVRLKNPKYCDAGYYEIRFKMPKVQGVSFAMFLYTADEGEDLMKHHINSKNYVYSEIDFAELKVRGNSIEPLGGIHITNPNTGKKVSQGYEFNQATFNKLIPVTDSWFEEWHTLQAVWNNNKLDLYYDGELFRNVSIPDYFGEAYGKYGFILRPEYCDYPWEKGKNSVDWSDTEKHDYQIDYVRYYSLK